MVLIDNDDCIESITVDRCAIIVFLIVLAQSLLVSCSDGIHLRFQCMQTYLCAYWRGLAPAPVSISDEVNPVYLLDILNMILINCKYYCSLYSIAIIEIQNLVIL